MTVTYTAEVATCRGFGCFLKLLLRWRGSIYKLVWLDLSVFLTLYYALNIVYRTVLDTNEKQVFERIVQYCATYSNLIPLSFVLGFYVSIVMTRWWNQYTSIPWPDPIAVFVSSNIHGQDERGRVMRRTVMRYVCLCLTMVLINVSPRVKKRFPTLDNLVEAGLLVENEKHIIETLNEKFPRHSKHWLPIVWAASIITRARKEGRIRDDFAVKTIIDELNKFRGQCGLLISYDTISIPLVYTQVVTLAVYSYFLTSVMGQQWIEKKEVSPGYLNTIDLYFPLFTTLQFFFYMGWLKVAESLINPFGEDDDDFEVNWMVDRNLQVSYLIVDEMHHEHPELIKDQYWDEIFPNQLPYTIASERFREEHPQPSTAKIEVAKTEAIPSNLSSVKIDEMVGKTTTTTSNQSQNTTTPQQNAVSSSVVTNYKFPDFDEEVDDTASGIHFTAGNGRPRHLSTSSSPSMVSLTGTISRVNTVASALKRFLSRDDGSRTATNTPTVDLQVRLPGSVSSASLGVNTQLKTVPTGSIRLTDQVIEEVDEQLTITSIRGDRDNRPTVHEIFGAGKTNASDETLTKKSISPATAPITIPQNTNYRQYTRTQSETGEIAMQPFLFPSGGVEELLNASTPSRNKSQNELASSYGAGDMNISQNQDEKQDEPAETDGKSLPDEDDDFEKLRLIREKERQERQKQKIARTISTQPPITVTGSNIEAVTETVIFEPNTPTEIVIATPQQPPSSSTTTTATTTPGSNRSFYLDGGTTGT